jgi:photosystem II stability/assembly factor-like uncharacterized protein
MKTLILLFIALTGFINFSIAQWVQVPNGMGNNRYVYTLAAQGNNLFAGTSSTGVFLSTNNGTSWTQTSLTSPVIHALFPDGSYVFAGTAQQGVYLTTNNGTNWVQTSLNNKTIYSFTKKNNTLFAGSDSNGVYKSTNNGTNWTSGGLAGRTIYALGQGGGLIFAGDSEFGMYVTTDEGTSWIAAPVFNLAVFDFAVDSNIVFAGTSGGIYKSTNHGFTWSQLALTEESVSELVLSGNNIFAGTFSGGVYVSNDFGANWVQRNEGLTQLTSSALCISNNYIFNGTQNSVFRRPVDELIGITQIGTAVPQDFALSQNYPNPFNPVTNIKFQIPKAGYVKLSVFDLLGKEIKTLVNEKLKAGTYNADWYAGAHPSGVYFYSLNSESFTETKKMILIK